MRVAAVDEVDRAGELGEVVALLRRRVAAADDDQRLVAEARQRPVADGAGADAAVLEPLLRLQAQVVGAGAGRDDDRVRLDASSPAESVMTNGRRFRSIVDDVLGDDARCRSARPAGACASISSGPDDAFGEAGEILDLGREVELPERERAAEAVVLGERAFDRRAAGGSRGPRRSPPSTRPGRNR